MWELQPKTKILYIRLPITRITAVIKLPLLHIPLPDLWTMTHRSSSRADDLSKVIHSVKQSRRVYWKQVEITQWLLKMSVASYTAFYVVFNDYHTPKSYQTYLIICMVIMCYCCTFFSSFFLSNMCNFLLDFTLYILFAQFCVAHCGWWNYVWHAHSDLCKR